MPLTKERVYAYDGLFNPDPRHVRAAKGLPHLRGPLVSSEMGRGYTIPEDISYCEACETELAQRMSSDAWWGQLFR